MTTFYEQMLARPVMLPSSVANLRTEPSAKFVQGQPAEVPIGGIETPFAWDTASLAVDNGVTVIKPNDILPGNPGRFLINLAPAAIVPLNRTLYVDLSYVGVSTGSIAAPYVTIQTAINAVPAPGVDGEVWTILIAGGNYAESPVIPTDRIIILQSLPTASFISSTVTLGPPAGPYGNISWNLGLVVNRNGLGIRGLICNQVLIFASVVGGTTLAVDDSAVVAGIVVIAGVWTGTLVLNRSVVPGGITAANALMLSSENLAIGATSLQYVIDSDSRFTGSVLINEVAAIGTSAFKGSFVTGPISCPASNYRMDDVAMRFASKAGAFVTTPASGAVNLFRGGAGFYQARQTVRFTTANVTLNYADDYLACAVAFLATIVVTLPDASMFAGAADGTDTAGGVIRVPGRSLVIKNIGAAIFTGNVQISPLGGDRIDGGAVTTALFLFPGEYVELVPVFTPSIGAYSWEPDRRMGRNPMASSSAALAATAGAVYVTKAGSAITTPAFGNGLYRVNYRCLASVSNTNTEVQSRLRNVTDAVDMVVVRSDPQATTDLIVHTGWAYVLFAGVAKTFAIDFQAPLGPANAQIQDAGIELWRVG